MSAELCPEDLPTSPCEFCGDPIVASPGVARSARKMGRPTYLAHAATCPRAGEWNRPARRARRRPSPQPARRRR